MDVDLEHPAERVWRALTEEKLLTQWLELPGFVPVGEAEVTGVEGQRRLAMLWGNDELSTRLVWELAPTPDGATLTLRQSCVYGDWEDEQRDELRAAFDAVLRERLPAILDWVAFQEVDLTAPTLGSPVEPVTQVIPFVRPDDDRGSRGRRLMALVTATLVFVAILAVAALTRSGEEEPAASPRTGAPRPSPSTTTPGGVSAIGTGAASPSPSKSPSASPTPSRTPTTAPPREGTTAPAPQPLLAADYETRRPRLFGYDGEVTVRNTGQATAQQWAVVVTLRDDAELTDVDGVEFRQDDRKVTFTGSGLAASGSITFTFKVNDAHIEKGPEACEVGGKPCS